MVEPGGGAPQHGRVAGEPVMSPQQIAHSNVGESDIKGGVTYVYNFYKGGDNALSFVLTGHARRNSAEE